MEWEDGSPVDYGSGLAGGQTALGDACIRLNNNQLMDHYCYNRYGYLCQRSEPAQGGSNPKIMLITLQHSGGHSNKLNRKTSFQ